MEIPTMKTRFALGLLLFPLVLTTGVAGRAQTPAPTADARRELTIVVVDELGGSNSRYYNTFNRIARVFTEVFEARKWPVKINVERFGANAPTHEIEMRIYVQSIRRETPVDLVFSAWMTLDDHGKKQDFGVVRYRYSPHPTENVGDQLDQIVRGAANIAAAKIEPVLFPAASQPHP
jgi:hypothetical protein